MEKDPKIYIDDILTSIRQIEKYRQEIQSKEEFQKNIQIQDAVIRRLEIIGEAVRSIPTNIKDRNTDVPWREIAGTRDKLIHQYFGVDLDLVWNIIEKDLPKFKKQIEDIQI